MQPVVAFCISIGVGYCFIHSKGNARACYKDKAVSSHTFFFIRFHLGIVGALYSPTMKKTVFNLICKLWCTILLCFGILTGCDLLGGGNSATLAGSNQSIRPCKIDMAGVQGFAIVENTSNAPRTKADRDGDGVDDDMPNGNGGGAVNTSPYSLYTIDENGELQVSIFYFEAAPSEDGQVNNGPNEQVLNELTGVLQIVPSLVTDLGKYILFSGCQYQILDSDISDEARTICETFIQNNNWFGDIAYMTRKSDGALFDLSNQPIFSYYAYYIGSHWHPFPNYANGDAIAWPYIPSFTYTTSAKGNLFVRGAEPVAIYAIEDNGDAIDVKKMTQDYGNSDFGLIQRFAIDSNENIYAFNRGEGIHIYYADGGFNTYEFEPSSSIRNYNPELLDMTADKSGVPYIFLISNYNKDIEEINSDGSTCYRSEAGQLLISARLNNGVVEPMSETCFDTQTHREHYNFDSTERHYYLGHYNDCFNWCLRYGDDNNPDPKHTSHKILSYAINTHICTLRDVSAELMQTLSLSYDAIAYGSKTYCAIVKGNSIEVTEVDFASETSRKYSFNVDISAIVSPIYSARMTQDIPYLMIEGRNKQNGAKASFTINLINGETNSSFAQDGRNVVSFFRIN